MKRQDFLKVIEERIRSFPDLDVQTIISATLCEMDPVENFTATEWRESTDVLHAIMPGGDLDLLVQNHDSESIMQMNPAITPLYMRKNYDQILKYILVYPLIAEAVELYETIITDLTRFNKKQKMNEEKAGELRATYAKKFGIGEADIAAKMNVGKS